MQLTRTVLAIALAASNANALPTDNRMSGERNDAQHRDGANIEGGSVAVQKRSHHPGHLQGNLASDRGQGAGMNSSQGRTAAQVNTKAHQQDLNAILNGNAQQSDRMIQVLQTPDSRFKDQESTRPFANKNLPSMQQTLAAESENMAKTEPSMAANNHRTAVASNNKAGFTLKVRELIKSLAQGREQMHSGSGQQNQDKHRVEDSIGIRKDRAEAQPSSNEMNMDSLAMDHDAQAGMRQEHGAENQNRNQVLATQYRDNVNQEISRVSALMSPNNKIARSHTGLSLSMAGHQEEKRSNSNQESRAGMQQQQQQQQEQNDPRSNYQMKSHSQMMECLRAAMGDIHNLCVSSDSREDAEQSRP